MNKFVENTPCLNVRDWEIEPYTNTITIDQQRFSIEWKQYKLGIWSWFLCPECGRRCIKLYLKNGCWACRECHKLVYKSQWQSKENGLLQEYHELLPLLQTGKPKWQHSSTCWKKESRFGALQEILLNLPPKVGPAIMLGYGVKNPQILHI